MVRVPQSSCRAHARTYDRIGREDARILARPGKLITSATVYWSEHLDLVVLRVLGCRPDNLSGIAVYASGIPQAAFPVGVYS